MNNRLLFCLICQFQTTRVSFIEVWNCVAKIRWFGKSQLTLGLSNRKQTLVQLLQKIQHDLAIKLVHSTNLNQIQRTSKNLSQYYSSWYAVAAPLPHFHIIHHPHFVRPLLYPENILNLPSFKVSFCKSSVLVAKITKRQGSTTRHTKQNVT